MECRSLLPGHRLLYISACMLSFLLSFAADNRLSIQVALSALKEPVLPVIGTKVSESHPVSNTRVLPECGT
eukprot:1158510-Pelagomonas_calceolata.AAC.3